MFKTCQQTVQKENNKKMHHWFDDYDVNKTRINTGQKRKAKKKAQTQQKANDSANNQQMSAQFAHAPPKQTGQRRQQDFLQIETATKFFLK